MIKKFLVLLLAILLSIDIGYSFLQHFYTPFDGDMAGGIVPSDEVKPILDSPFGLKVFDENITYPNPNRFFCHWIFYEYFNRVPSLLQHFTTPINSAYLSCAIAKTAMQVIITFLLAIYVSGRVFRFRFLLAAVLITPFFQTYGYRSYMGIIDPATTYSFFYALPIILILIYFAPLFLKYYHGKELKWFKYVKPFWIPLALISSLSGPLNPGVSLVIGLLIFIFSISRTFNSLDGEKFLTKIKFALRKIPNDYYYFLIPLFIFSLYSLYLGRFNSVDIISKQSLSVLYSKLPEGIFYSFTQKLGFPILFLILIINSLFIHFKLRTSKGKQILMTFKWIGIFALVYIMLLPLGGYRDYRPYILRYDTIIPITLGLMFIFAKTTIFIYNNMSIKQKYWYAPLVIIILVVFTNSDKPNFDHNACERKALVQIANSTESVVKIDNSCTVLSWDQIANPSDSELNIELLKIWGIIEEDKLYFQAPSSE